MPEGRIDELRRNLQLVESRLTAACEAVGRRRDELTLIAVTKTFPADDIRRLRQLGVRDIGENREQEATRKVGELADVDLTWHFVGRLQTNKCRAIAGYADVVHSVDRDHLAAALGRALVAAGRVIDVFVQVSLDDDPRRGGAPARELSRVADAVAAEPGLRLVGLMAIAPLGADVTAAFARLTSIAVRLRADHPEATAVSAGMSGDLEAAVAAGATHVRIGTALLGGRVPLVR